MSELASLPPAVRSYVGGYVARGRRLALVRRAGVALCVFLAWALLCCAADRFAPLNQWVRLSAAAVGFVAALAVLAGPLRRWVAGRTDWVAVAAEIEEQNPRFGQRLVTVTSRLLGRPEHRGSDEILEHLVYQVDREVSEQRASQLLPLRSAAAPWLALLLLAASAVGLCFVPNLGLPKLAARFAAPLRDSAPVTTTRLTVSPGDRDVPQSNPLQIDVEAERVDGDGVWVALSTDGRTWSRSAMTAQGEGRFSFTLASVDQDLHYYVVGGDARSRRYAVRVQRSPAVSDFRIRYTYPAYTGKPPLTVTNTDGLIEAPVGSEALVTITATEPLQLALLTAPGGEKILLTRAGADNVRQGRVTVQKDGHYQLDLVSTRDMAGSGPPTTEVRAQPDRPPVVRLSEAGATLRLKPRDLLPLSWDVIDDYGIRSVTLRAQVGADPAVEIPLYPHGTGGESGVSGAPAVALAAGPAAPGATGEPMPRHLAAQFDFDLADVRSAVGDVLTLVMTAKDSQGQPGSAPPIHVLVSPHSNGPDEYDRLADLGAASALADTLAEDFAAAIKAADAVAAIAATDSMAANVTGTSSPAARRDRNLSAAGEAAAMIRRSLLRATAHGPSPALCVALASWIDAAQILSDEARDALRASGGPAGGVPGAAPGGVAGGAASREALARASELSRDLQASIRAVNQGERAAAVLDDRENLAASEGRPAPADGRAAERLRQTLQRTRETIAAAAADLGLGAGAGDLDARLREKVAAGAAAAAARHPVDFAAAAAEWAQRLSQHSGEPGRAARAGSLEDRLQAAAEAEAVRPDSDMVRARDLQLAARAALALRDGERAGDEPGAEARAAAHPIAKPANPATLAEFAVALAALQREHQLNRRSGREARADEGSVRIPAERARRQMSAWAGEELSPVVSHPASMASAIPPPVSAPSTRSGPAPTTAVAKAAPRAEKVEALALVAGALSAGRHYDEVAAIDRMLVDAVKRQLTHPAVDSRSGPDPTPSLGRTDRHAVADPRQAQLALLQQQSRDVENSMKTAAKIDGVSDDQRKLTEETRRGGEGAAPALAARQREVADRIAHEIPAGSTSTPTSGAVNPPAARSGTNSGIAGASGASDDPNWRDRETAAILAGEVRLAAMPRQLTDILEAAAARRQAAGRAKAARREADAAPPDHRAAAGRAAEQAEQDAAEAGRRLESAADDASAKVAQDLAASLEPFAPEASPARAMLTDQLMPAMKAFGDAARSDDAGAAERAAAGARQAVETCQRELAGARDVLAQRDPLVSAKWFARAAADALGRKPPDFHSALRHQDLTSAALARAWDLSVHQAAARRLAEVPALRAVYAPAPAGDSARPAVAAGARPGGAGQAGSAGAALAAGNAGSVGRDWRHLAPRGADAAASPHQADPAGYEAALRAYFEALGKVEEHAGGEDDKGTR